jgi:TRAP transporter TAXI family solute receptor
MLELEPGRATDLMMAGELDAFFLVAGFPAAAVADLAAAGVAELLPIEGPEAASILKRHRFLSVDRIPAGTYEGVGAINTLSIGAQWVVSAEADEGLIYQITRALWHPQNRMLLDAGHVKAKLIRLETALTGISIPLHAGAARFYRDMRLPAGGP